MKTEISQKSDIQMPDSELTASEMLKQLPNLYPMRFLLCAIVFLYHIPLVTATFGMPSFRDAAIFEKGMVAVYYFFTLSGFLIIRLLYNEYEVTGTVNLVAFYKRRIQRLYPVYFTVIAVGLLVYHVVLPLVGIDFEVRYTIPELLLYYVFFIPNVFNVLHPETGTILYVLWSIGVEEQFYIVCPILLYLARQHIIKVLWIILVVLLLLLLLTNFFKYNNFYFYFASGGLCAILGQRKLLRFIDNGLAKMVILACFVGVFTTNVFDFSNPFVFHVFNTIVSGLTLAVLAYSPPFIIRNRFVVYLGKISYGLYMYHMIVLAAVLFVSKLLNLDGLLGSAAFVVFLNVSVFAGSFVVSALSYEYFERIFYKPRKFSESPKLPIQPTRQLSSQ